MGRPQNEEALALQRIDGGGDDLVLLAAHRAGLAGVRVEGRDRELRLPDAEFGGQRPSDDPGGRLDFLLIEGRDRVAQGKVDRDRHHAQAGAGQHHHRSCAVARKLGQEFGVPRMGESGLVEHLLVDRIGDQGACLPGANQVDSLFNRREHARHVRGVRSPRRRPAGQLARHYRQAVGKCPGCLGGRFDLRDFDRPFQRLGKTREAFRIVEKEELGERHLLAPHPGLQAYLRADSGRLAHGDHDRAQNHILTSRNAARRRSLRYLRASRSSFSSSSRPRI